MEILEVSIVNIKPLQREVLFEDDASIFIEGNDIVEVYDMDGLLGYGQNRLNCIRKKLNVKFIEWRDGIKTVS